MSARATSGICGVFDAVRSERSCADCLNRSGERPDPDCAVPVWRSEDAACFECAGCARPLWQSAGSFAFPLGDVGEGSRRRLLVLWHVDVFTVDPVAPRMPDGTIGGMRWHGRADWELTCGAPWPGGPAWAGSALAALVAAADVYRSAA